MIATNKGMDLMPLHKCASGGELARIMLALKVNLNEGNQTLIFDEHMFY
jgi:DNA repair ATPase RecN